MIAIIVIMIASQVLVILMTLAMMLLALIEYKCTYENIKQKEHDHTTAEMKGGK